MAYTVNAITRTDEKKFSLRTTDWETRGRLIINTVFLDALLAVGSYTIRNYAEKAQTFD